MSTASRLRTSDAEVSASSDANAADDSTVQGASHQLQLSQIPPGSRVLDAGCAMGYTAEMLGGRGCDVTGFERDPARAELAKARCSRVHVGDLESEEDRGQLAGPFDVILFGDVLEHLRTPTSVLQGVRPLLAPGGKIVASVPNIAVWRGRWSLLRGRWDYADSGLFDRTHVRFFTRSTVHRMAEDAGYTVCWEGFARDQPPFPLTLRRILPTALSNRIFDRLAATWPELFALQIVVGLRPNAPGAG